MTAMDANNSDFAQTDTNLSRDYLESLRYIRCS